MTRGRYIGVLALALAICWMAVKLFGQSFGSFNADQPYIVPPVSGPPVLDGLITNLYNPWNYTFDADAIQTNSQGAVLIVSNTIHTEGFMTNELGGPLRGLGTNVAGFIGDGALELKADTDSPYYIGDTDNTISNWTGGVAVRFWFKLTNSLQNFNVFLYQSSGSAMRLQAIINTAPGGGFTFAKLIAGRESFPNPDAQIEAEYSYVMDTNWHRFIGIIRTNEYIALQIDENAWSVTYTNFPVCTWATPVPSVQGINYEAGYPYIDQLTIWAGNFTTNEAVWAYDYNSGIGRTNTYNP